MVKEQYEVEEKLVQVEVDNMRQEETNVCVEKRVNLCYFSVQKSEMQKYDECV